MLSSLFLTPLYECHFITFQWNTLCFCFQLDLIKSSTVRQYKNFQIEESSDGYKLYGTDTVRSTLGELLQHLESQNLRSDNLQFQLVRCCPPQPRGKLNSPADRQRDRWWFTHVHADTPNTQILAMVVHIESTLVHPIASLLPLLPVPLFGKCVLKQSSGTKQREFLSLPG